MLRLAAEGKPLRVVNDQVCTPTAVADLASAVIPLVEREAFGLFHLTNGGSCSWFEFARAIFELRRLQVDLSPCSSAEFPRKAKRPHYSVLANHAYNALGLPPLQPWREALCAYLGG
jgi:dTDP-4-dehydrorhamnose reductase